VTNQIELSLSATSAFANGDLAFLQECKLPAMAWPPLGSGSLFAAEGELSAALHRIANEQGADVAAVAIAWLLAHPARILPVLGTNNLQRIAAISTASQVTIDRQTWFELYSLAIGHAVP
jgi:predicted oxidoreductase